jgi:diaminohydroxyphosphoribosylaminopyrimidine deaminase/5-amino-6-(5-phosphoribosylamino)uracil reductase
VLQLLVEGGARVAHDFLAQGLVDRCVAYLAPALLGGDDGAPVLRGAGAPTMAAMGRGRFVSVARVGEDLRVEVEP